VLFKHRNICGAVAFLVFSLCCAGCDKLDMQRTRAPVPLLTAEPEDCEAGTFGDYAFQLWSELNSAHTVLRAREMDLIDADPSWSRTLRETFESVQWEPVFTHDTDSPRLEAVLAAMDGLGAHGLKPEHYPVDGLKEAIAAFRSSATREAETLAELEQKTGWTELRPFVDRMDKPTMGEMNSLPEPVLRLDAKDLEKMLAGVRRLSIARKDVASSKARVEVLATVACLKYIMDQRFRVAADPFHAQPDRDSAHEKFSQQLVETFGRFLADPAGTLASLPPTHPYYARVMKALETYRAMEADGPFPEVRIPVKYRVGMKTANVLAIKQRLAREGYFTGTIDESYDADLVAAVKKYQEYHGFETTGLLEPRHEKSLNVPLSDRIQQIELSLQRWRESAIRDGGELYVRVNIPEFMMEVWKGTERVFHNRVVVGNNKWGVDPTSEIEGKINRTKIFQANIVEIVINPRWNVPARVKKVELEYDLMSQPDYLLKNNYVVETLPDGREIVYQKSGEGNALGKIKFNFPNEYGIFMHDTNMKSFFKREIRAYSHGCVRLDDPVPVAKFLLAEASSVVPDSIDTYMEEEVEPKPRYIKLTTPVPIYMEYNSVGIGDDGLPMFFSDVYSYDRDYLDGKIPYSPEMLELLQRKITQPE